MKLLLLCVALLLPVQSVGAQTPKACEPEQNVNARFRLFRTENMWTQILLDTRLGTAWQVSFSVSNDSTSVRLPVNEVPLVAATNGKDGRFTLYPTDNMWTFLLVDQDEGQVWQLQYSMKSADERFLILIRQPKSP